MRTLEGGGGWKYTIGIITLANIMNPKVKKIFQPTIIKIALFVLFMVIVAGGYIQTYAFTDGEEYGLPKPPLYDLIDPIPFWPLWMMLSVPLFAVGSILSSILSASGVRILSSTPFFFIGNIVYFYILASLVGYYLETHYKPQKQKSSIVSHQNTPNA